MEEEEEREDLRRENHYLNAYVEKVYNSNAANQRFPF
jgi:hypothetical protein